MKTKIVAIILCVITVITFACGKLPTFANASTTIDLNETDIAALEDYADALNQTLSDENTTAEDEINNLSNELSVQIGQTTNSTQINNLTDMKSLADELRQSTISTYSASSNSNSGLLNNILEEVNVTARAYVVAFLLPAISMLAYCGYTLSAELFAMGLIMQEVDEPYIPAYGFKVRQSKTFKNIAEGSAESGSGEFPEIFKGNDGDLYLAIHRFKYTKPSSISKTVTITDDYDYNDSAAALKDFPEMVRPVIKGVCLLHREGLFTYYGIQITETLLERIDVESIGYAEVRPYLGANEIKDYEIMFSSSGVRLIQTFGDNETVLCIVAEDGKVLAIGNNNGFNHNSLLSYEFEENKLYVLRIKFADETKADRIKLSVFCDWRRAYSFNELNLSTIDVGSYFVSALAKNVYMAKIVPAETKCYTINFIPDVLYRAFLIDMSSTDIYSGAYCTSLSGTNKTDMGTNGSLGIKDPVIIEMPGEGGDSNTIRKTLTAGKQYLLIACACPADKKRLKLKFTISN